MNMNMPLKHPGITNPVMCKEQQAQGFRDGNHPRVSFLQLPALPTRLGLSRGTSATSPQDRRGQGSSSLPRPQADHLTHLHCDTVSCWRPWPGPISLTFRCPGLKLLYLGFFLGILGPTLLVVFLAPTFYIKINLIFNWVFQAEEHSSINCINTIHDMALP